MVHFGHYYDIISSDRENGVCKVGVWCGRGWGAGGGQRDKMMGEKDFIKYNINFNSYLPKTISQGKRILLLFFLNDDRFYLISYP